MEQSAGVDQQVSELQRDAADGGGCKRLMTRGMAGRYRIDATFLRGGVTQSASHHGARSSGVSSYRLSTDFESQVQN